MSPRDRGTGRPGDSRPQDSGPGTGSASKTPSQQLPGDDVGSPRAPPPSGPGSEVGQPGAMRLLTVPLATEASWLLPLALLGIPLLLRLRWPLWGEQPALVLWVGWLVPELLYFSFTSGLFHAYYLIMLGPPLAALTGATVSALAHLWRRRHRLGWALLALFTCLTVDFQVHTLRSYPRYGPQFQGLQY